MKKCRQGKHHAQFSAMPSTTGTDYKNNSVCLYSIKIIYKIIIILYLVVVNTAQMNSIQWAEKLFLIA